MELTGNQLGLTAIRGRLLDSGEVAALLGVSDRWVQMHMKNGTFPIRWYPIGIRARMVDSADLDDWLYKIRIHAAELQYLRAAKKIKKKGVIA